MSRTLSEAEIVGLPAWAWTLIWFGAGLLVGSITVVLFNCWWRREVEATRCPYPPSRAYLASRQLQSSADSPGTTDRLGLSKSDALRNEQFTGSIADSTNIADSVSISHWRHGHGLHPVCETDPGCSGDGVYSPSNKSALSGAHAGPLPSLGRNSGSISAHLGAADLCGPSATSASGRLPAVAAAGRGGADVAPGHERNVSAVSSIGPSVEYDEEELDDDWKALMDEVNALLRSKQKEPIRDAKERATVVNSLLVSTTTRSRDDCVRNAAIDMLTFRKMHERTGK